MRPWQAVVGVKAAKLQLPAYLAGVDANLAGCVAAAWLAADQAPLVEADKDLVDTDIGDADRCAHLTVAE